MIFLIRIFLAIAAWKAIPLDSPSSSVHIIYGQSTQGSSQHIFTCTHIPPGLLTQISFSRCPFALIPSVHSPTHRLPAQCHTSPWEFILHSNTSDCKFVLYSAWFCLKLSIISSPLLLNQIIPAFLWFLHPLTFTHILDKLSRFNPPLVFYSAFTLVFFVHFSVILGGFLW